MRYYNIEEKSQLMKKWYDGYLFGKSEVYNPWSVLNQVKEWSEVENGTILITSLSSLFESFANFAGSFI